MCEDGISMLSAILNDTQEFCPHANLTMVRPSIPPPPATIATTSCELSHDLCGRNEFDYFVKPWARMKVLVSW